MNKILVVILVTLIFRAYAQERVVLEKPTVDERVELLSIVFYLAESPEYSNVFKLYSDRIAQHFEKHKNHELIQFTKSMRKDRGLSHDSPMRLAILLDENLNLSTNFNNDICQKDPRWTKENVEKFIPLLQKFAKETQFGVFFQNNTDLYAESVKCFAPLYEPLNLDWYFSFYGKKPSEIFSIILGLVHSGAYGPSLDYADGSRKVFTIVGVNFIDSTGMPKYDYNTLASLTMIHEFNHSFVNYLIDKNKEELRESGEKIFPVVKDVLAKQACTNWETMMCEALVRAAVIKYMKDHDFDLQMVIGLTQWEKEGCGFLWIEELVAELESYDKQRDIYPTLESYMPKIIEAYKTWAATINTNAQSKE
jgi:hypothetical protein